ncbi:MAG: SusC/RagA family TonB-linked outer membrane protein [Tannerellaceae bacterium]|nr:SusC/RagA family TonB-linked outer membrane protein [Tannerellaceae bacterium]
MKLLILLFLAVSLHAYASGSTGNTVASSLTNNEYEEESPGVRQQKLIVTGTVTDINGVIPGANVMEKGTTNGVITNIDGEYLIQVTNENATLVVSFIGYLTLEIPVNGRKVIHVVLSEETLNLEEVVVVGYGIQKKRDLTGAVAQVKSASLEKEHPSTVQDILRANIPGLNIGFSNTAQGGGGMEIRGKRSIKASNEPLLVVDGIIYYGDLNELNPNDIEQIDVLKDASSAAVYGAKSAAGVILITTKKGVMDRPTIQFNASIGAASLSKKEEVYSPQEYLAWREDVQESIFQDHKLGEFSNPNSLPPGVSLEDWISYRPTTGDYTYDWLVRLGLFEPEIDNYRIGRTFDWYDETYQTGLRQDYNANISGRKDKISYFWSLGHLNNEGIVIGDQYKTYRSRLKFDFELSKWLSAGVNIQYSNRNTSAIARNVNQIWANTPYSTPKDTEGTLMLYPTGIDNAGSINSGYNDSFIDRAVIHNSFTGTMYAKISLPFNISWQANYSPRMYLYNYRNHRSSRHPVWVSFGGDAERTNELSYSWQLDNLVKWEQTFSRRHQVEVTLLQNAEENRSWSETQTNRQFAPNDVLGYHRMQSGTSPNVSTNDTRNTGDALMARLFYSFDKKYMLTASVRRDGYSAFGMANPRATFPSVALGWVFTEEPFFRRFAAMDFGKLRLSWGENGNRAVGMYAALSEMSTGMYIYQDLSGKINLANQVYVSTMENKNLKWETTASFNAGLDFSFLNRRISGNIDVYNMLTTDLLIDRSLTQTIGFDKVSANLGEIQNTGFEVVVNTLNIKQENLQWNTIASFSLNRNKINHLYGDYEDVLDINGNTIGRKEKDDIKNEWFIGHDISSIWTYNVIGVWQESEAAQAAEYGQRPGDIKIKDVDNNKYFDNNDKEFIGYSTPRFRWTLRNEFAFLKNWTASFLLYSYWGHKAPFQRAKHFEAGTLTKTNYFKIPYWTPDNPTNRYARLYSDDKNIGANFYRELSFIRLDNISVSYAVPKSLLHKTGLVNMNLSFSVKNVGFWAPDWDFYDPEAFNPSSPDAVSSSSRTYTLGINFTL